MRRIVAALILSLCFALPTTAHADSFKYTIINNLPNFGSPFDFSPFIGTYTFTTPSAITGNTFIYGPDFTDPPFTGFTYIYAPDFTGPVGSPVTQIMLTIFPLNNFYAFTLYGAHGGGAIGTSLLQDPQNPTRFTADYGPGAYATMEIADLGTSQVPEPSTIAMLGTGILGIAAKVRRRRALDP
jgi:hypothetical protein